ncbi:MAG: hypothetical protein ACYTGP_00135 [Planctomycetota bacterium]
MGRPHTRQDIGRAAAIAVALAGITGTASAGGADVNDDGVLDRRDLEEVVEALGRVGTRSDVDGDGVVSWDDVNVVALRLDELRRGGETDGLHGFLGVSIEAYVGDGWVANGYANLTTYRLYADFDPGVADAGVIAVFGSANYILCFDPEDAVFFNAAPESITAPQDLTPGYWENQWDTYITINSTNAFDDDVIIAPNLEVQLEHLLRSTSTENSGWLVPPQLPQGLAVDGRVLIAQFTVPEGKGIHGTVNMIIRNSAAVQSRPFSIGFDPDETGPCCLTYDCVACASPESCAALGGIYLGPDEECPPEMVHLEFVEEPGGEIFVHVIRQPLECEVEDGPGDCVPGPFIDAWSSPADGQACQTFGVPGSPAIPPGFFAPGSEEFIGNICLVGVALGPIDIDEFQDVDFGASDTLVRRSADPFDVCDPVSDEEQVVSIQIEALKLRNTAPITIIVDGAEESWNVDVDLSTIPAPPGQLTARKTHCNGGTYTSVLHVQARFTFWKVGAPGIVRVLDTGLSGHPPVTLDAQQEQAWLHELTDAVLAPSPFCTSFFPGFGTDVLHSDCDCNRNGTRDACDIDAGTVADVNANGTPDPCECLGDINASGAIGFDDVFEIIGAWGPCPGCPEDLNADGVVAFADILVVVANWGECLSSVACCLGDGTCFEGSSVVCAQAGGTFVEGECLTAACSNGACCYQEGTCLVMSPEACATQGGYHHGPGTECIDVNCSAFACCLPAGTCIEATPTACIQQNGVYQGFGAQCEDASCPVDVCAAGGGTCLIPNETPGCADLACCHSVCDIEPLCCDGPWDEQCVALAFQICPGAGACCFDGETCAPMFEIDCTSLGGVFEGEGLDCSTVQCTDDPCFTSFGNCGLAHGGAGCNDPSCCGDVCAVDPQCCDVGWDLLCAETAATVCQLFSACCFDGGNCINLGPANCISIGGVYQGAGTTCASVTCSLDACTVAEESCFASTGGLGCANPTCCSTVCTIDAFCCDVMWDAICASTAAGACPGLTACCLPDGSCVEYAAADCLAANGADQGPGTTCANTACEADPCAAGTGDCFQANGTPGCDDSACCGAVCAVDPFCCDVVWDEACAQQAQALCGGP